MMKLKDLLYKVSIVKIIGTTDVEVLNIQFDSRKIVSGGLFVAISGDITDGHKYIEETILSGAKVIIVEKVPQNIKEIEDLQRSLNIQLANVKKEANVALKEKEQQIDAALEAGEIIPERASLEKEKAKI